MAAFKSTWMCSGQTEILVLVRELTSWIDSNLLLDLKTAPFDRADASLVADAESCHECTKRTGANSLLFPETLHDACLDGACWKGKVTAYLLASVELYPQLLQISPNCGLITTAFSATASTSRSSRKHRATAMVSCRRNEKGARTSHQTLSSRAATSGTSSMSAQIPRVKRITGNTARRGRLRSGLVPSIANRKSAENRES